MPAIRHWGLCLLALWLSACAAPRLAPEQASAIRRVGVVSLLPQEVRYRKTGITVFNNEYRSVPAGGDVFNATARATVERYLRGTGKYEVRQIAVDVPGMAGRLNARTMVMSQNAERIDAEVANLAQRNGVDAVLVVAENFDPDRGIHGLNMSLRAGVGDIRSAGAQAGLQMAGVLPTRQIFMGRYAPPRQGVQVARPDGKPWTYRLDDNLDPDTQQEVVKALQQAIENEVSLMMVDSGL